MAELLVPIRLDDETTLLVAAEQHGGALVARGDVVGRLSGVSSSVEKVSREMLEAAKRAAPTKAIVEIGFSLAVEEGHLVALVGKARGEATLTVTLEWDRSGGD